MSFLRLDAPRAALREMLLGDQWWSLVFVDPDARVPLAQALHGRGVTAHGLRVMQVPGVLTVWFIPRARLTAEILRDGLHDIGLVRTPLELLEHRHVVFVNLDQADETPEERRAWIDGVAAMLARLIAPEGAD